MKKKLLVYVLAAVCCCGCGASTGNDGLRGDVETVVNETVKEGTEGEKTPGQENGSFDTEEEPVTESPVPTEPPIPTEVVMPTQVPVDTEPPVISGLQNITVNVGEAVSYRKGVSVTDNLDEEVELEIDASEVDLQSGGTYQVRYTATDDAGNITEQVIEVVVKEIDEKEILVNDLADKLIAELITEDMSKWDTCYKLWNWCRTNIKYSSTAGDMSTIYAGAYEGLHDKRGDCYAYYATFEVLLKKCGIECMAVRRVGGDTDHWWNLVNLGDGWYHCDSSPRKKGHKYLCFMQTDAQVQAYTDFYTEKKNYFVFDKSLYPERGTEIVFDGDIYKVTQ